MRLTHLLFAATAVISLASPALAHRQWLLPSTTTLSDTSQYVTVDAAASNDLFYPDHVAMNPDTIAVQAPDGSSGTIENAAKGRHRTTFDVKIDKPGTWKIGTETDAVMGGFMLNGEQWRVGGRRGPPPAAGTAARPMPKVVATAAEIPAGATDVKLTEVMNRNAIFVTAGAPSEDVFKPTGKGLEMQPITHPAALVADEEGQFRFLVDGKPAAGVKVTVVPGSKKFRESEGAQELTTGADGVLHVTWPVPGVYWMSATMTDAKATAPRATERRMGFITTLEVPAP